MRRSAVLALALITSATALSACRRAESQVMAGAGSSAQASGSFTGTVAESINGAGYTYVRLQAPGQQDVWIAAPEFTPKPGEQLTVALEMPMRNFESQTLKRTFDLVYFVSTVSRGGAAATGAVPPGHPPVQMMSSRTPGASSKAAEPIAPPRDGLSIADLWKRRRELAGAEVTVRGRVVKANNGILGTNWIHLQDGSGSESDRTNDITVTTDETLPIGEIVTMKGVLALDKDFGSGYAYDAIIEKARSVR